MITKTTSTIIDLFHKDLKIVKKLVYDPCGFDFTNPQLNPESVEYGACTFELDGKIIEHRVSKITPTKTGQFVAIWKRNKERVTEPFDSSDNIDFLIITARSDDRLGQFIFPKSILFDKGIFTHNGKVGKRGIRVYPPWDKVTNKQAAETQQWQTKYFLTVTDDGSTNLGLIKEML